MSFHFGNTSILNRREGKYVQGHNLQEDNVSRPISAKLMSAMAKL
jgi:hypothetical protein